MYCWALRSNIVVGVDGSLASDAAVGWAAHEAMMRVVPIKLINVVAPTLASSAMAPNHTITQGEELRARRIFKEARRIVEQWPAKAAEHPNPAEVRRCGADACRGIKRCADGRGGQQRTRVAPEDAWPGHRGAAPPCELRGAIVPDPESAQHGIGNAPVLSVSRLNSVGRAAALAFDEASRRGVPLVALLAWSDVGVLPILGMDLRTYRDQGAELLSERLAGWRECYPDVQVQQTTGL